MQFRKGDRVEVVAQIFMSAPPGSTGTVDRISKSCVSVVIPGIEPRCDGPGWWHEAKHLRLLSPCADCGERDMNDRPHDCEGREPAEPRPAPAGMPESEEERAAYHGRLPYMTRADKQGADEHSIDSATEKRTGKLLPAHSRLVALDAFFAADDCAGCRRLHGIRPCLECSSAYRRARR